MVLSTALVAACSAAGPGEVQITGNAARGALVLETIRAAERGDAAGFGRRIGRSAERTFHPPTMSEVDRTDEGCTLRSVNASIPMVSVLWSCGNNTNPNVQRSFLVEHGRVTHVWNDWAEVL